MENNATATYVSSPLRRRSLAASKAISRQNSIPDDVINDDAQEILHRRRRESELIAANTSNRRQSIGLGNFTESQLHEKILHCIKLNAENKINIKNAFSLPVIDILTYTVTRNMTPNLQLASSSLDVGTKIYGLRVDKVYSEVNKIFNNLGKNDGNESTMENETMNNDENVDTAVDGEKEIQTQKKKKKKKVNMLSSIESLKSTPQTLSINSVFDSQTSDDLFHIRSQFTGTNANYLSTFDYPKFDQLEEMEHSQNQLALRPPMSDLSNFLKNLSFAFTYLNWTENENVAEESCNDTFMDVDDDNDNDNVYRFDLEAAPDNTPFPSQDIDMQPVNHYGRSTNNEPPNLVDFTHSILTTLHDRESEYTYMPFDLLHFSVPSHWKIVENRSVNVTHSTKERCRQAQRRKKIVGVLFEDTEYVDTKFNKKIGQRLKISENAQSTWIDTSLIYSVFKEVEVDRMFKCFLQKERYLRKVTVLNKQNQTNDNKYDDSDEGNDINFEINCNDCDDANNDNGNELGNDINVNEIHSCSEPLTGDNLINAPTLVDNINIPYSKKAKKIDVRQMKKSMMKIINKNCLDKDPNNSKVGEDKALQFSEMYKELPKLLSKNNAEAINVPIAFMSLLHLANEKTLSIKPEINRSNLLITKD